MEEQLTARKLVGAATTAVLAVVAAVLLLSVAPTTTAEAGVNSLRVASGTISAGEDATVEINADENMANEAADDISIIITAGRFKTVVCYGLLYATGTPCMDADQAAFDFSDTTQPAVRNIVIGEGGTKLIVVEITCPKPGPATIAITAIQSGTAQAGSINCAGEANTMEAEVRNKGGDVIANIRTDDATMGEKDAFVRARAKDSNGNVVKGELDVIFTTSDGALKATDAIDGDSINVVELAKSGWATIVLVGSSTDAGDDATVTASLQGRSADAEVHFSGDPEECTITADPVNPAAGSTVDLTVLLLDSSGGPVADGVGLNESDDQGDATGPSLRAVNAQGTGTFALFGEQATGSGEAGDGIASAKLAVGLTGGTGIFVSTDTATCSTRVAVSETVMEPAVPTAAGVAGFTGAAPAANSIGLLVTSGASTAPELVSALADAGCVVESLAILTDGVWSVYISGAPDVVNAAFPASLAASTPFFVRC